MNKMILASAQLCDVYVFDGFIEPLLSPTEQL